jgi:hypothetical protein
LAKLETKPSPAVVTKPLIQEHRPSSQVRAMKIEDSDIHNYPDSHNRVLS